MLTVLVSVWDKTGLPAFLNQMRTYHQLKVIATSSTHAHLVEQGIDCIKVEDLTQFPEILGGRVKTLHPKIFAGILSRSTEEDKESLKQHGIDTIDMVVVSLYPFEKKLQERLPEPSMIEYIDIGGVSLLRAAAKNFQRVAVVCDNSQYDSIIKEMEKDNGAISEDLRRRLALHTFQRTSEYDTQIYRYFAKQVGGDELPKEEFPTSISLKLSQYQALRYGENPHQAAVWYSDGRFNRAGNGLEAFPPFTQLQGKELSSNNITDTYCLVRILRDIGTPSVCIIKHNNPCGVAVGKDLMDAYDKAYCTDPTSAFGGIFGFTDKVTLKLAQKVTENFIEIIAAPDFDEDALELLKKKKNVRVLKLKTNLLVQPDAISWHVRDLQDFGFILEKDVEPPVHLAQFQRVTGGSLEGEHIADASFAWAVVKHLTSNAIFIAKHQRSLGFGIGQTSRIASVKLALEQAGKDAQGAVLASDAFFPSTDNIEAAKAAGIDVIVQPGGSIKDKEVIEACDKAGITMLFTGQRCFKH